MSEPRFISTLILGAALNAGCIGYDMKDSPIESGLDSDGFDGDGDGYTSDEDCDDRNAMVNPGAQEICNDKDDDCDGEVNESLPASVYYQDEDHDGYGNPDVSMTDCTGQPDGYVSDNTDCDDTDDEINPEAREIRDGHDNDCDGEVDEVRSVHSFTASDETVIVSITSPHDTNNQLGFMDSLTSTW